MKEQTKEHIETSDFNHLIQDIMSQLVGAHTAEINKVVDNCLRIIGEYFQAYQVGLGQWSKAGKILPALRTWGPKPSSDYLKTTGPGPEAFAFLCRRGSLTWNCIEDLEELPQLQEHARHVGAIAGAFWLYRDHGSHTEHLVIAKNSSVIWSKETIDRLATIGGVLFTAIYRRRAEIDAERLRQLQQTLAAIASEFVHLSPERVAYCRTVTKIWCAFFVVNGSVALWLSLYGSLSAWGLYTGAVAYGLMGLLFVAEYTVRRLRFR